MLTYYIRLFFTFFSLVCLLCGYIWFEKEFMLPSAIAANHLNAADAITRWQKIIRTEKKVFGENTLQNTHFGLTKTRLASKFNYIYDTKGIKIEVRSNSGNVIGKLYYDNKLSACATFKSKLCFYTTTNHSCWTNDNSLFSEHRSFGSILTNSIQRKAFRKNTREVFTFNYYPIAHYSATLQDERLQFLTQESYKS